MLFRSLIHSNYSFFGCDFRLSHFEDYGSRESQSLSEEKKFHEAVFNRINEENIEKNVNISANRKGTINGIQLKTYVKFSKNMDYTASSSWLNPPLNLPIKEDIPVKKGDELNFFLNYRLGGGLESIDYRNKKMK